jgi:hypothetical protein
MASRDKDDSPNVDADGCGQAPAVDQRHKHWAARTAEHLAADWWEVRDGAVRLTRQPREGEALPVVEASESTGRRVGGGRFLPVYSPDGALLSYGRSTE